MMSTFIKMLGTYRSPAIQSILAVQQTLNMSKTGKIISQIYQSHGNGWQELLFKLTSAYRTENIAKRYSIKMIEFGWPPDSSLNLGEIKQFLEWLDELGENVNTSQVDDYIVSLYQKDRLNEISKTWKSKAWLSNRYPILEQAFNAHLESKYYIAIPAILPQIEGILIEGFGHKGWVSEKRLREIARKLLKGEYFDDAIFDFYINIILARFEHGIPISSVLSRHAILHGGDTNYGTEVNSLKTILLFDYLQDSFKLVGTKKGMSYHLINCPYISKCDPSSKTIYKSHYEAEIANKKPCKRCNPNHQSA